MTSLFSAVEGAHHRSTAVLPPPATDPFQAPDFGDDETFAPDDAPGQVSGRGVA
ncbi:hypothetical protein [Streptomyces antibioticus]|uniref:Uncharacterized protein n=1 Tax=Streptomyces antibioticus TaxID=1890 RepID=A0AAE6YA51_STRAT|nr:hypothetical protein [Streptomyces antibioticus]MCX4737837.1 hypothetical protein [Streptomyces antibioticus]MCX5170373.1 hypothetical protein [Streptomyces antibioticus]QIT45687.1 hypothetical protein HCX60_20885 [Streptomyces antibioticus]